MVRFWTYLKDASNKLDVRCKRMIEVKDDLKSFELGSWMYELPFAELEKTVGSTDLGRKGWRSCFGRSLRNLSHIQVEMLIEQLDI